VSRIAGYILEPGDAVLMTLDPQAGHRQLDVDRFGSVSAVI
jgi:hypothetical protein